eukprot:3296932-Amphidinium_carterae.1
MVSASMVGRSTAAGTADRDLESGVVLTESAGEGRRPPSLAARLQTAWCRTEPAPSKEAEAQHAGDVAESMVADAARTLAVPWWKWRRYVTMNVRVPTGCKRVTPKIRSEDRRRREVDVLVLSKTGIVCIEVKHWGGQVRCGKRRWAQQQTGPAKRGKPTQDSPDDPASTSSARHTDFQAGYVSHANPVMEIQDKAMLVRRHLQHSLDPEIGKVFAEEWAVQGKVVMLGTAQLQAEDPESEADMKSVVRREGVINYMQSLRGRQGVVRKLMEICG